MHNLKCMPATGGAVPIIVFLSLLLNSNLFAQQFLPEVESFSGKKAGFLINMKGDTIRFIIDDLYRKDGLIVNVTGKTPDGKKLDCKAQDIKVLAIPPSNYGKLSAIGEANRAAYNSTKASYSKINRELVYFFQEYIADLKRMVLVQLVNPDFESKIRVYDDPNDNKKADDKSYYVNYNNKVVKLNKSNYDIRFKEFSRSCPELATKYPTVAWKDFAEHVFFMDQSCQ